MNLHNNYRFSGRGDGMEVSEKHQANNLTSEN